MHYYRVFRIFLQAAPCEVQRDRMKDYLRRKDHE